MIRLFDITFALLSLMILSPIFIVISLLLRMTGEGEIFFLQRRIGFRGNVFHLIKFVTMLKDSPNIGTKTITVYNDPRILKVGHFLRKTKINELPQLINVLYGDMSLIGPRPLTTQTFSGYQEEEQKKILSVRPGLSGIGSIVFRDEEAILKDNNSNTKYYSDIISPYKAKLEIWFVERKSLLMYFLLIFITIYIIVIPNVSFLWRIFTSLPEPPLELKSKLSNLNNQ